MKENNRRSRGLVARVLNSASRSTSSLIKNSGSIPKHFQWQKEQNFLVDCNRMGIFPSKYYFRKRWHSSKMCPNLEKVPPRNFFLIHFAPATASILDVEWFAFCKLDIILSDVCKLCHEVSLLIASVSNSTKFWSNAKYLH